MEFADQENKGHYLIYTVYPTIFIFELLEFMIVWTEGLFASEFEFEGHGKPFSYRGEEYSE